MKNREKKEKNRLNKDVGKILHFHITMCGSWKCVYFEKKKKKSDSTFDVTESLPFFKTVSSIVKSTL